MLPACLSGQHLIFTTLSKTRTHEPRTHLLPHPQLLADAVAARTLLLANDILCRPDRERVDIALTGGTDGIAILRALASSPLFDVPDWSKVHLWWGTSASWLRTAPSAMPWEHMTRCSTCCWKRNASPAIRFTKCLQTAVRRRSSQPPPIRTTPWRWRLRRPIIRTSSKRNSVRMAIWTSRCSV